MLAGVEHSGRDVEEERLTQMHPIVTRRFPRVNTSARYASVSDIPSFIHSSLFNPHYLPPYTYISFIMPVAAVTTSAGKLAYVLRVMEKLTVQPGH